MSINLKIYIEEICVNLLPLKKFGPVLRLLFLGFDLDWIRQTDRHTDGRATK